MKKAIIILSVLAIIVDGCSVKRKNNADNSHIRTEFRNYEDIHVCDSIFYDALGNDTIRKSFILVNGTWQLTQIFRETLTKEIIEEMVAFCDMFIETIQSDNIEKIKNVIDFPVWVECFKDFTFGDTITTDNFFQYKTVIFDDVFFENVRKFKTLLKKGNTEEDIDYGFDMDTFHFRISTSYQLDEKYDFGKNRLFRFEKHENKYKLVLVFCAG